MYLCSRFNHLLLAIMNTIRTMKGDNSMATDTIQITDHLWESVLEGMREKITHSAYETWIVPLKARIEEKQRIILIAPNEFTKEWINEKYKIEILEVLNKLTGNEYIMKIVLRDENNGAGKVVMNAEQALGYLLLAAREAGLPAQMVKQLHNNFYAKFDFYSPLEAEEEGLKWFHTL